jgi:transcriptional regulator with XRE-family HTH domain
MNTTEKIQRLKAERSWSSSDLAFHSGISVNTIESMRKRSYQPSITTLEYFCKAFGITLAQFFTEDDTKPDLSEDQIDLINRWSLLNRIQQNAVSVHIDSYIANKSDGT